MVRGALLIGLWIGVVAGLGGCIAIGGSSSRPTKGQELIDLKAALDRGAITEADYETTKSQILGRS